ncbi:hypothetical protein [Thermomonas sp.]|uniref:hypothetical protein n=1 Tax=Thermomonas sp. TaxID=1971895 RepID=UPI0024878EE7|nr:hypothetical protein [Thermomonas sp.]MDI1253189.1 hypothetical protein [Thermomonas sp.]
MAAALYVLLEMGKGVRVDFLPTASGLAGSVIRKLHSDPFPAFVVRLHVLVILVHTGVTARVNR